MEMNIEDRGSNLDAELSQELIEKLSLETGPELTPVENEHSDTDEEGAEEDEKIEEEEDNEEGEFSFMMCGDSNSSPIAAEDAFVNGQIKPIFPFFNQDFTGEDDLPTNPPVKNVFVELDRGMTSSGSGSTDGPFCEWSDRKAVEVSAAACKKSNSTGFSKIWRFKELMGRSNSDGRDTFVFLNDAPPPPPAEVKAEPARVEVKAKKTSTKKVKKPVLSAHEVYLKSKAKDDRRRSYLPYRPELMGFFTNMNSGLTKNVHPY